MDKILLNVFPLEIIERIMNFIDNKKDSCCIIGIYCRTCKTYKNCRYHKCYYPKMNFKYNIDLKRNKFKY